MPKCPKCGKEIDLPVVIKRQGKGFLSGTFYFMCCPECDTILNVR